MSFGQDILKAGLAMILAAAVAGPVQAQSAFFRELVLKPRATQADGVRVVSILLGKRKGDLQSDTDFLKERGVMPHRWNPSATEQLSKGYQAYLLVRALDISGGANARIWGMNKRRAYQELSYLQIMPPKGGEHAKLTGPELITLLDRSTRHRDQGRDKKTETDAPSGNKPEGKQQ